MQDSIQEQSKGNSFVHFMFIVFSRNQIGITKIPFDVFITVSSLKDDTTVHQAVTKSVSLGDFKSHY